MSLNIEEITTTVEPVIKHQEAVSGGFRPVIKAYLHDGGVLLEHYNYTNPPESDAWAACSVTYSEGDINELTVFRSRLISNHPNFEEIYRRVDLADMQVTAEAIKLKVIVKHFTDEARTQEAPFQSIFINMIGDNSMEIDGVGERDYWEYLTNQGYTPYHLWDARMDELDSNGRFNVIY
jgi:hypothetical protein